MAILFPGLPHWRKPLGYTETSSACRINRTDRRAEARGETDKGDAAAGHQLLHALGLCAGVIIAVTFEQVDCTPDAETGTKSNHKGLEDIYCAIEKIHIH